VVKKEIDKPFVLSCRVNMDDMKKIDVGFVKAASYEPQLITRQVDELCRSVGFKPVRGDHVVLKPNLVVAAEVNDLACTHPQFVAGVAAWFLDHGCRVRVGDSPAFGNCRSAMKTVGLNQVVQRLGLGVAPFEGTVVTELDCGINVAICRDALDCDLLVNLPKVKSHSLVRVTLAVKNYFGIVKGWRKAMLHQVHGGGSASAFIDMLCDLVQLVPAGISLCDGITAMHVTGPVDGEPFPLHLMGCSLVPHALDAGLLTVLGVEPERSPLWCRLDQRAVFGNNPADISFPLLSPQDFETSGFIVPAHLDPVRFTLKHVLTSLWKRLKGHK
jgi:uncharacterized protein (DUF362 family)